MAQIEPFLIRRTISVFRPFAALMSREVVVDRSGRIAHSCFPTDGVLYEQVDLSTQAAHDRQYEASQHLRIVMERAA